MNINDVIKNLFDYFSEIKKNKEGKDLTQEDFKNTLITTLEDKNEGMDTVEFGKKVMTAFGDDSKITDENSNVISQFYFIAYVDNDLETVTKEDIEKAFSITNDATLAQAKETNAKGNLPDCFEENSKIKLDNENNYYITVEKFDKNKKENLDCISRIIKNIYGVGYKKENYQKIYDAINKTNNGVFDKPYIYTGDKIILPIFDEKFNAVAKGINQRQVEEKEYTKPDIDKINKAVDNALEKAKNAENDVVDKDNVTQDKKDEALKSAKDALGEAQKALEELTNAQTQIEQEINKNKETLTIVDQALEDVNKQATEIQTALNPAKNETEAQTAHNEITEKQTETEAQNKLYEINAVKEDLQKQHDNLDAEIKALNDDLAKVNEAKIMAEKAVAEIEGYIKEIKKVEIVPNNNNKDKDDDTSNNRNSGNDVEKKTTNVPTEPSNEYVPDLDKNSVINKDASANANTIINYLKNSSLEEGNRKKIYDILYCLSDNERNLIEEKIRYFTGKTLSEYMKDYMDYKPEGAGVTLSKLIGNDSGKLTDKQKEAEKYFNGLRNADKNSVYKYLDFDELKKNINAYESIQQYNSFENAINGKTDSEFNILRGAIAAARGQSFYYKNNLVNSASKASSVVDALNYVKNKSDFKALGQLLFMFSDDPTKMNEIEKEFAKKNGYSLTKFIEQIKFLDDKVKTKLKKLLGNDEGVALSGKTNYDSTAPGGLT